MNSKWEFYSGKVVLITGASSGIGRALTLQLVDLGAIVVGISRDYKKLQVVQEQIRGRKGKFMPYSADISSYDGCRNVFEYLKNEFSKLDILVNNAGIGHFTPFERMKKDDYQYILNTNFLAPIHLTSLFLDYLKKNKDSRVINICSSGAYYGIPFRSIYCASKAGMRAWSQAISIELNRFGIGVLTIIPGSIQTNFFNNSLGRAPQTHRLPGKIMSAEELSETILTKAVGTCGEYIVSLPGKAVLFASAFVPSILKKAIQRSVASEEQYLYS